MWWEKSNNDSGFENENILFTESRRDKQETETSIH